MTLFFLKKKKKLKCFIKKNEICISGILETKVKVVNVHKIQQDIDKKNWHFVSNGHSDGKI